MSVKELKNELLSRYRYRIELHAHTNPVSRCSEIPPAQLAEIYASLGFDGLVVTNHFNLASAGDDDKITYVDRFLEDYENTRLAGEKLGLNVQLGVEVNFTENANDYLIFGVDRQMLLDIYDFLPRGVKVFRKEYPLPRSVFIHAHPFRDRMERVDASLLDGVEVFNMHPGHNSRVGQAAVYADENKLSLVTSGSDFHHLNRGHEGLAAIRTTSLPTDSFDVAALLKSEDYLLEVGRNHIIIP